MKNQPPTNSTVGHVVDRAITHVGSQAKLATALGVTQQTVSHWRKSGFAPVEHCAAIERLTGGAVTRQELCPSNWAHVWPELASSHSSAATASAT